MKTDLVKLVESELTESKEGIVIESTLVEGKTVDPILAKIGEIAKNTDLMGMRSELEKIFKKKEIDFSFTGAAHYSIKPKGGKGIMIVNKKYVSGADLIVGDIAIGFE